ncbi:MAG TPA: DUF2203 domain-containing protein [Candidatus Dormibacteraeota bacterium]|nr:DUF2203 domain-containing protein [Candidatus Dormibacteraeota bacterium]
MQRLRTYTVEEANNELPRVSRIVAQIAELSALLPELEDHARIAEYESKRPGAGAENRERQQQARDAVAGAEMELLKAVANLNGMGIQLKGPLEGLIDFPSYRDGELVELCWKLGEDKVDHWHRIGEGYGGRKKL